jgi:ArsR family transcriptional regulator, virulence genes transcriptional regulator
MKIGTLAPLEAKLSDVAPLLRIFANEQRVRILWRLAGNRGELPIAALASGIEVSRSALSQHLTILRKQGIVVTRRAGRNVFYRIADPRAARLVIALQAIMAH